MNTTKRGSTSKRKQNVAKRIYPNPSHTQGHVSNKQWVSFSSKYIVVNF